MQYHPNVIEPKWQKFWAENQTFKAENSSTKPKYYVLDMFPYPSGAGLHVGHPLGYIASDIYARFKRHKGFNILHPMGYDSFGLPAEQYAIQTGQHPAITTQENIARYREQLDKIGFSFDWSREVRTSNPDYYHWTQWIFLQLFDSYYDETEQKAKPITDLIAQFEKEGNQNTKATTSQSEIFSASEWNSFNEKEKSDILLNYRLTYLAEAEVNWCPGLGTVLANDEVVNGVSERGGFPVIRKKMTQWMMRITAYAERLLNGISYNETDLDWSEALKESQKNWIGKSKGASVNFAIEGKNSTIEVFTTRPDTIFGVSFMVLAPEHELVKEITKEAQSTEVQQYIEDAAKRSERQRMAEVNKITGAFTGAYAIHPFTGAQIPIWIGDYVLAGYGTGAVMSVPAGDERDYAFAKHFNIPIPNIFEGVDIAEQAFTDKTSDVKLQNSEFLNGLNVKESMNLAIEKIQEKGIGFGKVNYRLRDAVFSRQRYWGEPVPMYFNNGIPQSIGAENLPLELPEIDEYLPTESGEPPLGRAKVWAWDTVNNQVVSNDLIDEKTVFPLELNTMPGWAGSSWYQFRYMDSTDNQQFASKEALDYWQNVDLYIGGSEHATGHLLYSRFWTKFLKDRGFVSVEEPFKKLINQGMILGDSAFAHRDIETQEFISYDLIEGRNTNPVHVDVNIVNGSNELDVEAFKLWRDDLKDAQFIGKDKNGNIIPLNPPMGEISDSFGYEAGNPEIISTLLERAQSMRKNPTIGEKLLWDEIKSKKLGYKFRRQHPIGNFIPDFVCLKLKLIIEIDGGYHLESDAKEYDQSRTNELVEDFGYKIIRFTNDEITSDLNKVLSKIKEELEKQAQVLPFGEDLGGDKSVQIEDLGGEFIFKVSREVEKMSKSKFNVVNPDDICEEYGADTLRMYEMFLGPIEQSKPWNTNGLSGVFGFLKRLWKLYFYGENFSVNDEEPTKEEYKVLHTLIKKVTEDIEGFSFNTSISAFMIAVNDLQKLKTNKRAILQPLAIVISPFAPHIAEELWQLLGHNQSISQEDFPVFDAKYLVEDNKSYPISFNGKMKFTLDLPLNLSQEEIEKAVMADERTIKNLEGRTPKKVIIVPGKIVNLVG